MRGPKTNLTFQTYADVSDGGGGYVRTWSTVVVIRGVLNAVGGYERQGILMRDTAYVSHRFFCDYSGVVTLTEFKRAVLGSRVFEIKYPMYTLLRDVLHIFDLEHTAA